jgi:hypothetical protein
MTGSHDALTEDNGMHPCTNVRVFPKYIIVSKFLKISTVDIYGQ